MENPWRLQMLGGFVARRGRQVVSRFRTRKMGGLLAYLAFHRDQAHPREALIDRFWPEAPPCAGRQSLSQALCSLRHQLEQSGTAAGAVIVADRLTVRVDPRAITTDVAELEHLQLAAQRAPDGTMERRVQLQRAQALCRGEFLPGHYDDWVLAERERLIELELDLLAELGRQHERAGDRAQALAVARLTARIDPLREAPQRTLMRLLAESGQAGAALRQYRGLAARLAAELDAEPDPKTRALAHAIQERTLPRQGNGAHSAGASRTSSSAAHATAAAHATPAAHATAAALMEETCIAPPPPARRRPNAPRIDAGTVTFLLAAGDGAAAALSAAVERHGGVLVRAERDAGVAAFARAADALRAALGVQGPGDSSFSVALHSGDLCEPAPDTETAGTSRFHGAALERGERVLLAAHPRQVLVSEPAARLLESDLAPELQLADLGMYRLPGGTAPERLFQLGERAAPAPFPPPRADRALAGHVPLQLTRFFGRATELAQLKILLRNPEIRLLTLVGPGGTGKTRLALEAAGQAAAEDVGPVWFVPLADLADPEHLPAAVLEAMQRPLDRSPIPPTTLARVLDGTPAILVLDNLEHLLPRAAEIVAEFLQSAPRLRCVATSRRPLGVGGEWRFLVPPLAVPEGPASRAELATLESVQLFVDRARAVRPDFQITESNARPLAQLCAHLDGLPLAIELAAARTLVLGPAQMLRRLDRRFDFLATRRPDVPLRHRTLRATLEWSYRLLSPEGQRFFAGMAVFRSSMTVEAVEAVSRSPVALDHLIELRECSLLSGEEAAGEMRFRLLDTIREFAAEKLPDDVRSELERRHAEYYVALAERARQGVNSARESEWLDRIALEHENLRAVLDRGARGEDGDLRLALRLTAAIASFWSFRGYLREGRRRIAELLAHPAAAERGALRAQALLEAGGFALAQSVPAEARPALEESLAIFRELGDEAGIGRALNHRAIAAFYCGDFTTAQTLYEEGLAICRQLGDRRAVSQALTNLGNVANALGDYPTARARYAESLAIKRELGIPRDIATALMGLGNVAENEGDLPASLAYHRECLNLCRRSGDRQRAAWTLVNIGNVALKLGDHAGAGSHYVESLKIALELGDRYNVSGCLDGLCHLAFAAGDPRAAARLYSAAATLRRAVRSRVPAREESDHDSFCEELRAALGDRALSEALAQGAALAGRDLGPDELADILTAPAFQNLLRGGC
jgi:predicted ATPase/DNA-binding SARP family transcriptional activator